MTDPNRRLIDAIDEVSRSAEAQLAPTQAPLRRRLLSASSPRPRMTRWLALAGVTAALAIGITSWWRSHHQPLTFKLDEQPERAGAFIAAEGTPRRLAFSEGTEVEVALASRAQVVSVDEQGATIRLDTGRVSARVTHRDDTRWRVEAGPYVVRVTGTRFTVAWDPARLDFEVTLQEGSVEVSGPLVGTRRVRAGERLSIAAERELHLGPLDAGAAPTPDVRDEGPVDAGLVRATTTIAPVVAAPPAWLPLARAHAWNEAWAKVSRLEHWCATSGAEELLLLADVARFSGHPREAVTVLRAVRRRFPRTVSAHEAGYLEGLVHVNALGEPAVGFDCFLEAFEAAPQGPLAEEALSRALELAVSLGRSDARALAGRYLDAFPAGAQRGLARRTLETPPP